MQNSEHVCHARNAPIFVDLGNKARLHYTLAAVEKKNGVRFGQPGSRFSVLHNGRWVQVC